MYILHMYYIGRATCVIQVYILHTYYMHRTCTTYVSVTHIIYLYFYTCNTLMYTTHILQATTGYVWSCILLTWNSLSAFYNIYIIIYAVSVADYYRK